MALLACTHYALVSGEQELVGLPSTSTSTTSKLGWFAGGGFSCVVVVIILKVGVQQEENSCGS